MTECERVPIKTAAKELGIAPAAVRERMRQKVIDIGTYIPKSKTGKSRDSFLIYRPKLDAFIGRTEADK